MRKSSGLVALLLGVDVLLAPAMANAAPAAPTATCWWAWLPVPCDD